VQGRASVLKGVEELDNEGRQAINEIITKISVFRGLSSHIFGTSMLSSTVTVSARPGTKNWSLSLCACIHIVEN
jgi:hypothetical protein